LSFRFLTFVDVRIIIQISVSIFASPQAERLAVPFPGTFLVPPMFVMAGHNHCILFLEKRTKQSTNMHKQTQIDKKRYNKHYGIMKLKYNKEA